MKFFALALAALVGLSDARKVLDEAKLLRSATPIDSQGNPRQLQNGYYGGYYSANAAYNQNSEGQAYEDNSSYNVNNEFGGTYQDNYGYLTNAYGQYYKFKLYGYHSIKFETCISLKTEPDQDSPIFDNYLISYTKNGKIVNQQSYVIFKVCETAACSSTENRFVVDLATFMAAMVDYVPTQRENYCTRCEEAQNYCENRRQWMYENQQAQYQQQQDQEVEGQEGAEGDEAAAEGEQGGERRLTGVRCSVCESYGCFGNQDNAEYNDEYSVDMEAASEWVQNFAACQQTGQELNGMPLYAGFICNSNGDGVELAPFVDESCNAYTSATSFNKIMKADAENDPYWWSYLEASKELVTYPFTHTIDCKSMDNNNDANNYQQYQQANDFCLGVYEQNARSLARCAQVNAQYYHRDQNTYYNVNQDYVNGEYNGQYNEAEGEAEAEEEQYNEDGIPSWYKYDLSQDDMENNFAVCRAVARYHGDYSGLETYDSFRSGTNFNYGSSNTLPFDSSNFSDEEIFRALKIIGIVALALGATAFLFACGKQKFESYKGSAARKTSLVRDEEGNFTLMKDDEPSKPAVTIE